jgi:hypothetical protein
MTQTLLRTWFVLLHQVRIGFFLAFLCIVLLPFVYPWRGRTEAQFLAARSGYFDGLRMRISDPVLWKRALVGGILFLIFMVVFGIAVYHFSLWAHSLGGKKDESS